MTLHSLTVLGLLLMSMPIAAQQSTLVIRSDADCNLTVNGSPQGSVTAGSAKAVTVTPGEQLVECVGGGAKAESVVEVFPGTQKVVKIGLATKVQVQGRFKAGAGVVLDNRTGLTWLDADNGSLIEWNAAMSYCARFSPGTFSLPTLSELQAISGTGGAPDSPLFELSSDLMWSSESYYEDGSRRGVILTLRDGRRYSNAGIAFPHSYALCVRRSP